MEINRNPSKGFRSGPGNPLKIDEEAKLAYQLNVRNLQFGTDGTNTDLKPPKCDSVRKLLLKASQETLDRTGMKTQRDADPLTIARSTEKLYREELSLGVVAKDLTNVRYVALSDCNHMYQTAVMITAFSGHLKAHSKGNIDGSTYEMRENDSGEIIKENYL